MRVLVVDDDVQILTVADRILRRAGHEVTAVAGPSEAFRALALAETRFDVILCDMNMPRMTGPEFASKLSALDASRVVYTTGLGSRPGSAIMREHRILLKPFTPSELVWTVEARGAVAA